MFPLYGLSRVALGVALGGAVCVPNYILACELTDGAGRKNARGRTGDREISMGEFFGLRPVKPILWGSFAQ